MSAVLLTLLVQGTIAGSVAWCAALILRQRAPQMRLTILWTGVATFVVPVPFFLAARPLEVAIAAPGPLMLFALVVAGGTLVSLILLAIEALWLRRLLSRATIAPLALQEIAIRLATESRTTPPVLLLTSVTQIPFAIRGAVVLPAAMAQVPLDRLEPILLHEIGHHHHGDVIASRWIALFRAMFWFHPVARALTTLIRHAIEERCDDFVLRRIERRDYAASLIELAAALRDGARVPAMAMASPGAQALIDRVRRVATDEPRRFSRAALLILILLVAIAAAATPRFAPLAGFRHEHRHIHAH
ncbi:MAG TPA: M56 family metallopeptidase [Thermoanaerobaculia bacterium]|nr:M56 family metallopeptidase [Thermoanaerobaculia bacterium]